MKPSFACAAAVAACLCAPPTPLRAELEPWTLSPAQRTAALEVESEAAAALRPTLNRASRLSSASQSGAPTNQVVTRVAPVPRDTEAPEAPRAVDIERFDYPTGCTIFTRINLDDRSVLQQRVRANRSTPLAPEELARAVRIARASDPAVQALDNWKSRPVARDALVLNSVDRRRADYGHRLVLLRFPAPGGEPEVQCLVDLTLGEVAPLGAQP